MSNESNEKSSDSVESEVDKRKREMHEGGWPRPSIPDTYGRPDQHGARRPSGRKVGKTYDPADSPESSNQRDDISDD